MFTFSKHTQHEVNAETKTIHLGFNVIERKVSSFQDVIKSSTNSIESAKAVEIKHDNRLGGYTTIVIITSLLCVGFYVAKQLKLF